MRFERPVGSAPPVDALDDAVAHASRRMVQMMHEFNLDMETGVQTRPAFLRDLSRLWDEDTDLGAHCLLHVWVPDHGAVAQCHGSAAGAAMIGELARGLQSMLRDGDLAGRLAADQLAAVLMHASPQFALRCLQKLQRRAADRHLIHGGLALSFRVLGAVARLAARPTMAELLDHVAARTRAAGHPDTTGMPFR